MFHATSLGLRSEINYVQTSASFERDNLRIKFMSVKLLESTQTVACLYALSSNNAARRRFSLLTTLYQFLGRFACKKQLKDL